MYVVLVTHNTGHGEETNVLLVTDDPARAHLIAVMVEKYGYEFLSSDACVTVYQPRPETTYPKEIYRFLQGDPPPPAFPVVYSRRKSGGAWVEEWWDGLFRSLVALAQPEPNTPA